MLSVPWASKPEFVLLRKMYLRILKLPMFRGRGLLGFSSRMANCEDLAVQVKVRKLSLVM